MFSVGHPLLLQGPPNGISRYGDGRIQQVANDGFKIKEGFLLRRSRGRLSGHYWKNRYLVLRESFVPSDNHNNTDRNGKTNIKLCYYRNQGDTKPKGTFDLTHNCTVGNIFIVEKRDRVEKSDKIINGAYTAHHQYVMSDYESEEEGEPDPDPPQPPITPSGSGPLPPPSGSSKKKKAKDKSSVRGKKLYCFKINWLHGNKDGEFMCKPEPAVDGIEHLNLQRSNSLPEEHKLPQSGNQIKHKGDRSRRQKSLSDQESPVRRLSLVPSPSRKVTKRSSLSSEKDRSVFASTPSSRDTERTKHHMLSGDLILSNRKNTLSRSSPTSKNEMTLATADKIEVIPMSKKFPALPPITPSSDRLLETPPRPNNPKQTPKTSESLPLQLTAEEGIKRHYTEQRKEQKRKLQARKEELLHMLYLESKQAQYLRNRKRLIKGSKYAAAAGATITAGIFTAGMGLAIGMIMMGLTAAAGGGSAVAEVGYRRTKGNNTWILAAENLEDAREWKIALENAIEHLNAVALAEGGKGPVVMDDDIVESDEESLSDIVSNREVAVSSPRNGSQSPIVPNSVRSQNVRYAEPEPNWEPLDGAFFTMLGLTCIGLHMFREEIKNVNTAMDTENFWKKIPQQIFTKNKNYYPPMKAQIILNASPLNAFMCLMSHMRLKSDTKQSCDGNVTSPTSHFTPNSGQRASFRILETEDEQRDVIHLFFRPLYLFPFWTMPRDFVVYRHWRFNPDGTYSIFCKSVEHESCPPLETHIRGKMHGVYTIAPRKLTSSRKRLEEPQCLLTSIVQVDPKGWISDIPVSVINQGYGEAFTVSVLALMLDLRETLDYERFVSEQPSISKDLQMDLTFLKASSFRGPIRSSFGQSPSARQEMDTNIQYTSSLESVEDIAEDLVYEDGNNYDYQYSHKELLPRSASSKFLAKSISNDPPALHAEWWAEPSANSFRVRGKYYKKDKKKFNAGESLFRLLAVDIVEVESQLFMGLCSHPKERVQMALEREKKGIVNGDTSDMPAFVVAVNIILKGPPHYHMMTYFAVDDMGLIDGSNGTPSSKLAKQFFFGESDEFRDKTFKLIPQIVEGNFVVRKAVGSTPCIMGKALKQTYIRGERFFELILDTGSSSVAAGVIKLCLGYARTISVDMAFLLEGNDESTLPEQILGCARLKRVDFRKNIRFVQQPDEL